MKAKLKELTPYITILLLVIITKVFVVTPIRVNGPSMEPTLYEKDIMILNKTAYYFADPKRFDIVVVTTADNYLIKRVIGLPGEKITYKDHALYVNDKLVEEPKKVKRKETEDFTTSELGSEVIPEDCYLVMGDNRGASYDSRALGFIEKSQIQGRTSLTILPFSRIGWKK